MQHTKDEILRLCLENRIACAPVHTFDEVLASPQLNCRSWFRQVDHPQAGLLTYPGAPALLHGSPARVVRPAPTLGRQTAKS